MSKASSHNCLEFAMPNTSLRASMQVFWPRHQQETRGETLDAASGNKAETRMCGQFMLGRSLHVHANIRIFITQG